MKLLSIPIGLALLVCSAGASAQMYKWVDDKGVTHYADQRPPASLKPVEIKPQAAPDGPVALPFELAEAVRNHPVTLYTTSQCKACDQGRALLQARGIPYAEKTVTTSADQARLAEAGSVGELPLLLVGSAKLIGFEAGAWNAALADATYPATRMLPSNYRQPRAEAAAPPPAATPQQLAREAQRAAEAALPGQAPTPGAKPEFQF